MASFQIVDDQPDFVVIDKAPNVNFHDEGDFGQGLFHQVKTILGLEALYPVHRLDKITSGLLIFAKNSEAAATFQQLFSEHKIEKYYLALSTQKPKKKQGLVKGDMAKSRRGMWKLMRTTENPAITQFFSYSLGTGKRAYILKPHSGKTHQIRVAMASIGAPILGDPLYSKVESDRGYLHAFALQFEWQEKSFEYELPPVIGEEFTSTEFSNWLESMVKPWALAWPKMK
ncbi:MAG: TIGR01621 family pseudouridine synthase [Colwelliaceae bacterium]|nr:TIGR01621 family pseudouridine synthase [Colwelliaceae bacterium]|tara:strand:+ start:1040 stop:1726 length:687 start_codon:yes stop_codon:yes gene_type:complete